MENNFASVATSYLYIKRVYFFWKEFTLIFLYFYQNNQYIYIFYICTKMAYPVSPNVFVGVPERNTSRVLKPPGGGDHDIFGARALAVEREAKRKQAQIRSGVTETPQPATDWESEYKPQRIHPSDDHDIFGTRKALNERMNAINKKNAELQLEKDNQARRDNLESSTEDKNQVQDEDDFVIERKYDD